MVRIVLVGYAWVNPHIVCVFEDGKKTYTNKMFESECVDIENEKELVRRYIGNIYYNIICDDDEYMEKLVKEVRGNAKTH